MREENLPSLGEIKQIWKRARGYLLTPGAIRVSTSPIVEMLRGEGEVSRQVLDSLTGTANLRRTS